MEIVDRSVVAVNQATGWESVTVKDSMKECVMMNCSQL